MGSPISSAGEAGEATGALAAGATVGGSADNGFGFFGVGVIVVVFAFGAMWRICRRPRSVSNHMVTCSSKVVGCLWVPGTLYIRAAVWVE